MSKYIYRGSDIRRFLIDENEFCLVPGKEYELPECEYVSNMEAQKVITKCVQQKAKPAPKKEQEEKTNEPKISE